jgi:quinol monooxygenase YgiN
MIIVLGSVTVQEGKLPQALVLSHEHVARSRAEPGCITHAVYQGTQNPLRLVFIEQWQDQPAIEAHFKVPESRAFAKALTALAVERPDIALFEAAAVESKLTRSSR